jgi:ABC-type thiamin/hydroxymethylpyrimidine transport system permease subunit
LHKSNKQSYRFSTKDLLVIALLAAIGIAIKPVVKTLTHLISTPLGIPGGTIGGGLYMMWLVLALALVPRFGAATLAGFIQGLVLLITGWFGSHGAISLLTYTLPGLAIDLLALLYRRKQSIDGQILYCIAANLVGTYLVGFIIMRMPKAPLYISLSMSVVSGAVGGVLAYLIYKQLKLYKLL